MCETLVTEVISKWASELAIVGVLRALIILFSSQSVSVVEKHI
jgi:hypothetical protein